LAPILFCALGPWLDIVRNSHFRSSREWKKIEEERLGVGFGDKDRKEKMTDKTASRGVERRFDLNAFFSLFHGMAVRL
jgi:hypothetical protein